MEIREISEAEFNSLSGSRGKWDTAGILNFAKELSEKYPNKVISMPLETVEDDEGFYNKFYKGVGRIKYINYYCRKRLMEAFETLGVEADVKTAKNSLLVQLRNSAGEEEQEEPEE